MKYFIIGPVLTGNIKNPNITFTETFNNFIICLAYLAGIDCVTICTPFKCSEIPHFIKEIVLALCHQ